MPDDPRLIYRRHRRKLKVAGYSRLIGEVEEGAFARLKAVVLRHRNNNCIYRGRAANVKRIGRATL